MTGVGCGIDRSALPYPALTYTNQLLNDPDQESGYNQNPLMEYCVFLLPLLLAALPTHAQFTVSGTVTDEASAPQPFVNVLLLNAADSSFVVGGLSEDDGSFALAAPAGTYRISVSALGFPTYYGEAFELTADRTLDPIGLGGGGVDLAEVVVTARQPLLVRQIDRTIVNVADQPTTAGLTALEVLERSPGVFINRQSGGISMAGKDGVSVLVNGRPNYVDASGLTDFLAGMSADNIEKIELITTPPANFDAQGNAGFINIILKELPDEGLNGNYNVTAGYGRDQVVGQAGLNVNYRKGKLAVFGGYDFSQPSVHQETRLNRTDATGLRTDVFVDRRPVRLLHNLRLGADYELGERTTLGAQVSGYDNHWDMDAVTTTTIRPTAGPDTLITSDNVEVNDWRHLRGNLNLRHRFAGGGRLTVDLDRLYYDNDNDTRYDQTFTSADATFTDQNVLASTKASPFAISVLEAGYASATGGRFGYAFGAKAVRSDFENDVAITLDGVRDAELSSFSELEESVYAAYLTTDYAISPQTALRAGLRYEYSDTRLDVTGRGRLVDRQFGELFPTLYLSHQLSDRQQLVLSYGRRITRPAFTDMAPFVIFLDPRTLTGGDPTLQPAIANVYELGYRLGTVNANLTYTTEDSTLVNFQNRFDPELGFQRIVPDNLREQRTVALNVSFPLTLSKAITARVSPLLTYRETVSDVAGEAVALEQFGYQFNGNVDVRLPKELSLQFGGFYRGRQLNGNVVFQPTGLLNVGVAKTFPGGGRLALNVGDVLNSFYFEGRTTTAEFDVLRRFDFNQRTVRVSWSAPFGKRGVRSVDRREAGEQSRIQN